MRQMIIRLLMAKLIPVGIKFVTQAFRKKKPAVDPNLKGPNEAPTLDQVDKMTD